MKNSKEMADAVFRIRDEYIEKKRHREHIFGRAALIAAPACLAVVMIAGGHAILSDKQIITADRTAETVMETAAVTATVTSFSPAEKLIGVGETGALKDGEETSIPAATTTKKLTETKTSLEAAEGETPETMIPDGMIGAQPEIFTTTTAAETSAPQTTTTTFHEDVTGEKETAAQPDDDLDGLPGATETVNEAAEMTVDSCCRRFPVIELDRTYQSSNETVTEDMLAGELAEYDIPSLDGETVHGTVYYIAGSDNVAVRFEGTDMYIVYVPKGE